MAIEIRPYKILIFYDIPELLIAVDTVKTKYLCLKTADEENPSYVTLPVSDKKINLIQSGLMDLRDALQNSEMGYWFLSTFSDEEILLANKLDWTSIPEEYLPETGFFFERQDEYNTSIVEESNAKYNTILHLSLTDNPGTESVKVESLADFIKQFQNLIKYTYKKEISQYKKSTRISLDESDNYTLRAYASSPGSFKLHLESARQPNMFGENNVEIALEKLDLILFEYPSDDVLIDVLRKYKGHSVGALKKLFEIILRDSIQFEYKWISQSDTRIRKASVRPVYANRVIELLKTKNDLSQEIVEFIGYVHQADVDRGNWRILNSEDEHEYNGISEHVPLNGITLKSVKYKFICEEIIEEFKVSGKEEKKYKLISFEAI